MVQVETLRRILRNDPRVMRRNYRNYSNNIDAFNKARQGWTQGFHGQRLNLDGINLERANLKEINFEQVRLWKASLDNVDFEGANLRGAVFDYTSADEANFRNADLRDCIYLYKLGAYNANFENADLRGAEFRIMPEKCTYDDNLRELLETAHFSGTKITPEQREQLVAWFRIPEDSIERKFIVVPRGQYRHGPNDYFLEKGREAHEKARKEGRIFTEKLNGDTLEYAVVSVQGNEDIRDHAGYAFSLVRTSDLLAGLLGSQEARYRGDWLYFVFDDVPEQFREFAAVHEFGEREGGSHREATIMEYERARSKGVLDDYLLWIVAEHPDKLIGDAVRTFAEEGMERLPNEVIRANESVMPKSVRAWKRKQENRKYGFPFDLWKLAWKGLPEDEIVKGLVRKGYDATIGLVEHWKEQMEIPDCRAIQKLTYLEPM